MGDRSEAETARLFLRKCLAATQSISQIERTEAESNIGHFMSQLDSIQLLCSFGSDVSENIYLRQLTNILLGQYCQRNWKRIESAQRHLLVSYCFAQLREDAVIARSSAMICLAKIIGVSDAQFASQVTSSLANQVILGTEKNLSIAILKAVCIVIDEIDLNHLEIALLPYFFPLCVDHIQRFAPSEPEIVRFAARIIRMSLRKLSCARLTGEFEADVNLLSVDALVGRWSHCCLDWLVRFAQGFASAANAAAAFDAASAGFRLQLLCINEFVRSLIICLDTFGEYLASEIAVRCVSLCHDLLMLLKPTYEAHRASQTSEASFVLELLAACLNSGYREELSTSLRSSPQSVQQLLAVATLPYMQLTSYQLQLMSEDANEFVSREVDNYYNNRSGDREGGDREEDGGGEDDGGMRVAGRRIVRALCRLCSDGFAVTAYLELICTTLTESQLALSKCCTGNDSSLVALRIEALLWTLGIVTKFIAQQYRLANEVLQERGLPPLDAIDSVALAAFLASSSELTTKQLAAVHIFSNAPIPSLRQCLLQIFFTFSNETATVEGISIATPDIICGRAALSIAQAEALLPAEQLPNVLQRLVDVMSRSAAHASLVTRLQCSYALGLCLQSERMSPSRATLMQQSPSPSLSSSSLMSAELMRALLASSVALCHQTNSNSAHIPLSVISQVFRVGNGSGCFVALCPAEIGPIGVDIVDALLLSCFRVWQLCPFDSLCIDAICDAIEAMTMFIAQQSGTAAAQSCTSVYCVIRLVEYLTQLCSPSSASSSASSTSIALALASLTSVDMFIELVGKLAIVSCTNIVSSNNEYANNCIASIVQFLISIVVSASHLSSVGSSAAMASTTTHSIAAVAKSSLVSLRLLLSDECVVQLLRQLPDHLNAINALVRSTVDIFQRAQMSTSCDSDSAIGWDSDCCGPCAGVLALTLLRFGTSLDEAVHVRPILQQLLFASAHPDNSYIQQTALMAIVHLVAHSQSTASVVSNSGSIATFDTVWLARILANISFDECPRPLSPTKVVPLLHLLELWSNLHCQISSSYCSKISYFGLFQIIKLFSQQEQNYRFAVMLLSVALNSVERSGGISSRRLSAGYEDEDEDDGDDDDGTTDARFGRGGRGTALRDVDDDEDYDDDDCGEDGEYYDEVDDEEDDLYIGGVANDPFEMFKSPEPMSTSSLSSGKRNAELLADLDTLQFISDELVYAPYTKDCLASLPVSTAFRKLLFELNSNTGTTDVTGDEYFPRLHLSYLISGVFMVVYAAASLALPGWIVSSLSVAQLQCLQSIASSSEQ